MFPGSVVGKRPVISIEVTSKGILGSSTSPSGVIISRFSFLL